MDATRHKASVLDVTLGQVEQEEGVIVPVTPNVLRFRRTVEYAPPPCVRIKAKVK
jgi:hypothetical protein